MSVTSLQVTGSSRDRSPGKKKQNRNLEGGNERNHFWDNYLEHIPATIFVLITDLLGPRSRLDFSPKYAKAVVMKSN